jgi:hypothetical protein
MKQTETIPLKSIEHCTLNYLTNIHVLRVINDIKEWTRCPWPQDV